jgi:pimeloyl-ACP methyl ester carboxylesterase
MMLLSTECAAAEESAPGARSGYAPVNGLKLYYEMHGGGDGRTPPLVLLHGGGSTIETTFGRVLSYLRRPGRSSRSSLG